MAHAYTTKRGKNKKGKLGVRKDNQSKMENRQMGAAGRDISSLLFADTAENYQSIQEERKKLAENMKLRLMEGKAEREKREGKKGGDTENNNNNNNKNKNEEKPQSSTGPKIDEKTAEQLSSLLSSTYLNNPSSSSSSSSLLSDSSSSSSSIATCGYRSCPHLDTLVPSSKKLLQCGGCRSIEYCSALCQKNDWIRHRDTCKTIKKIKEEAAAVEKKLEKEEKEKEAKEEKKKLKKTMKEEGLEVFNHDLFLDEDNLPSEDDGEEEEGDDQ